MYEFQDYMRTPGIMKGTRGFLGTVLTKNVPQL